MFQLLSAGGFGGGTSGSGMMTTGSWGAATLSAKSSTAFAMPLISSSIFLRTRGDVQSFAGLVQARQSDQDSNDGYHSDENLHRSSPAMCGELRMLLPSQYGSAERVAMIRLARSTWARVPEVSKAKCTIGDGTEIGVNGLA